MSKRSKDAMEYKREIAFMVSQPGCRRLTFRCQFIEPDQARFAGPPTGTGDMKKTRFAENQITYALRQTQSGTPVADVCR